LDHPFSSVAVIPGAGSSVADSRGPSVIVALVFGAATNEAVNRGADASVALMRNPAANATDPTRTTPPAKRNWTACAVAVAGGTLMSACTFGANVTAVAVATGGEMVSAGLPVVTDGATADADAPATGTETITRPTGAIAVAAAVVRTA
jgi:hypothetical protein